MITGIFILILLSIIILDIKGIISLTGKWLRFIVMLFLPQSILIWWVITIGNKSQSVISAVIAAFGMTIFYLYNLARIHLIPARRSETECCSSRITLLYGGQLLISLSLWGFVIQGVFYLLIYTGHIPLLSEFAVNSPILFTVNLIHCILFLFFILLNGQIRILFTCRRLGIVKRIIIIINLWFPVVNLFLMHYICRKAGEEYDQERCRFSARAERTDSNVCAVKYPIIMLHGIGFRDLRYFNYWGRIPRELTRNGAVVYYGHQEAWGTIEDNAECIRRKIEEVLAENNCSKVNIIAHSKGGLDARYLITHLGMADKVASLTTISTPHMGSELIQVLNKLPDSIYLHISALFDRSFSRFGDTNPDCYHASKQLAPSFCAEFNKNTPDSPSVYYQSYASVMKYSISDSLLTVPNLIMGFAGNLANDGLVSEESAKWGCFKGTFRNKYRRGISHGDMIDLKREDYQGFDILEAYVAIVSDLKNMGF